MFEFKRSFESTVIRMFSIKGKIIYSAYDVATALQLRDKRKSVNKVVIEEKGDYLNQVLMGSESVLFMSKEYVIGLSLKAEDDIKKAFLKWLVEVQDVASKFRTDYEYDAHERKGVFATTQVAKAFGLSAGNLNKILFDNQIQHKVNDQWVLYSKYQDKGYTKTVKVPKKGTDQEYMLHTYWTIAGVTFIEDLLKKLGYQRQGEQISLF